MADVRVDVDLNTGPAEKEAEGLKAKLGKTFGEMGKIAGGIFMAQMGGSLADKGVETFKNSIALARDFNEIQSKANTIFGESSRAINDWADNAAVGFGQSKAQALDAAATFGNMFSQLGMGAGVTADMSQKMVELASDFASFHNADITQVLEAQQAAFRGEYDAVQRFVPTINAAAVEMKALEMTGKDATKELTQQEKAVAAYQLMLDNAGAAMGDFERTSGSLSNQQRVLSAQWQNLQADIGQALIPALTAIVTTINTQVIPAVARFAQDVKRYWESDIKPAIENMKKAWADIQPVVQPVLEFIGREIQRVAEIVGNMVQLIVNLISGDFSGAWENAKNIVRLFWESIEDRFRTGLQFIQGLGTTMLQAGKDLMNALKEGLFDIWNRWIGPFFRDLPATIGRFFDGAGQWLLDIGKAILQGLWDGMKEMWGEVSGWVGGLGGQIKDLKGPLTADLVLLKEEGEAIMRGLGAGLDAGWKPVAAKLEGYTAAIAATMKGSGLLTTPGAGGALAMVGGGGGSGPTGAYGQNLVWDEQNNAWTYPWMTGGAFGQRDSSGGLIHQPFGGAQQPITVNVQIDRQTIATAVIEPWMTEQLTTGALQHGVVN